MRLLYLLIMIFVVTTISGCFSNIAVGPSFSEAKKPTANSDLATLYIYRWGEQENIHPDTNIFINSKELGALSYAGFTWVQLPAGKYLIEEKLPLLKRPLGKEYQYSSIEVVLEPGQTSYVNVYFWTKNFKESTGLTMIGTTPVWGPIYSNDGSGSKIESVIPKRALKEIAYCNYQKLNK